ncbi:MAG: hypothetical protein ACHRXM_30690 [Isosphaerales bacterium]
MNQESSAPRRADSLSIGVAMLLIAGAALGLWLVLRELRAAQNPQGNWLAFQGSPWLLGFVFVLGGLSLIGVPLLLMTARRQPWGAGRILWFSSGSAAWLLWPPVAYHRVLGTVGGPGPRVMSGVCFFYGTPLMAVYVSLALLAGGSFRRSRRRRLRRSWQETFGLVLGLLWACTGFYFITLFYRSDIFGR